MQRGKGCLEPNLDASPSSAEPCLNREGCPHRWASAYRHAATGSSRPQNNKLPTFSSIRSGGRSSSKSLSRQLALALLSPFPLPARCFGSTCLRIQTDMIYPPIPYPPIPRCSPKSVTEPVEVAPVGPSHPHFQVTNLSAPRRPKSAQRGADEAYFRAPHRPLTRALRARRVL